MSLHRTIIRYFLIIGRVMKPGYPSLQEIREMLEEHDFSISIRTLQRDIENIRIDFVIEIKYDPYQRGYYLDRELSLDIDPILNFMEMTLLAGTVYDFLKEKDIVREYISFESEGKVKGLEYMPKMLFALKQRRILILSYQKFEEEEAYAVKVKPGLLKEYQNRWYLLTLRSESGDFRAYALDRITDVRVEDETYPENDIAEIKERFIHVIGVSQSNAKPCTIDLTVTSSQWKYIESLPWHSSQEKIKEDETSVTFRLFVVLNYELEQKILGEGNNILRIEPQGISDKILARKN